MSDAAWARLHEVCLRGMCGIRDDDEESAVLISAGFVRTASGGLAVLPAGRSAFRQWARLRDGSEARSIVSRAYVAFRSLDAEVEQVVSAWQQLGAAKHLRLDRQGQAVVTQLRAIHDRIDPVLYALGAAAPRFAGYQGRLEGALMQVEKGRHGYLSGVMVDSYHTLWWHLHQDLVWALGLEGEQEAQ